MNFVTIRERITPQQAHLLLSELDEMAKSQEIAAFCGQRIFYIDYIAGTVQYRFATRISNQKRNVEKISRQEVIQFILNQ